MRWTSLVGLCSLIAGGVAGCDLLQDATSFTVETDWETFTIDTGSLGLKVVGASTIPSITCSAAGDICAQASAASQLACTGQSYSCKVACGSKGTCAVSATAEQGTTVDLSQKIKNNTQSSMLSKVSLNRVVLDVPENSLNFDTPQLKIFVGPSSAARSTDSGVVLFATVPAITKGKVSQQVITPTEAGKSAISNYVKDFKVPFKMLGNASLGFASGDPIPSGRATYRVKAYFLVEPLK